MDERVVAAMARWPDVPAVYGWLSLNERGAWRLHPRGDALKATQQDVEERQAGEAITSPPIIRFINRNYSSDENGQWFFQNGPQRVYVRLDAAPFILHSLNAGDEVAKLCTHNGLAVQQVSSWYLDDEGRLFAQTEHGAGLIAGRDLEAVMSSLITLDGLQLIDALVRPPPAGEAIRLRQAAPGEGILISDSPVLLNVCAASDIASHMGFISRPRAD